MNVVHHLSLKSFWSAGMVILLDNLDSFVYNLARYIEELGVATRVVRSATISVSELASLKPSHIILSPGPCTPEEAGVCVEAVKALHNVVPILGVCLGHQAIAAAFGGEVVRAAEPRHGKDSDITHSNLGIFQGLPNPLRVGRYHSLVVKKETLPPVLTVTATTAQGTIMAIEHTTSPTFGVQFHPESILTEAGFKLLQSFLGY